MSDFRAALDDWIRRHPRTVEGGTYENFRAQTAHRFAWAMGLETGSPNYLALLDILVSDTSPEDEQRALERAGFKQRSQDELSAGDPNYFVLNQPRTTSLVVEHPVDPGSGHLH